VFGVSFKQPKEVSMRALFALALLSPLLAAAQLSPQQQAQVDAFMVDWQAEQAADEAEAKKMCGAGGVAALPTIGMSEQRMLNCTIIGRGGMLKLVNTLEVPGAVTRQYEGRTGVKFVYARNGVVTGVQR
jgi:hypothetical protein